MAFGQFVAGDSLFVGIVIFLIMVIVQFMVITKGATRISEVAARFTLDAMPGKQMAIDADLNAGVIDDVEARRRREKMAQEADFFGAMDGASKFVRGDAIAGLIITIINVLGGFAVGAFSRGWDVSRTAKVFTTLTIGDGLSAQIPSFVIAIASALIVTRSGSKEQLGHEMADQVLSQPRGLLITGGIPVPAGSDARCRRSPCWSPRRRSSAGVAWAMGRSQEARSRRREQAAPRCSRTPEPPPVENLLKVDVLELEVGYGLVQLVDKARGATCWTASPRSGGSLRWSWGWSCRPCASATTCSRE